MIKYFGILVLCISSLMLSPNDIQAKISISNISVVNTKILDTLEYNDGPYVFIRQDSLISKSIFKGAVNTKPLELGSILTEYTTEPYVFKNVSKIAAFSDLHGQYDLTIRILNNNNIIDKNLNWSFGNGHLVIVGDIFDRGSKVTELLWFVYNLEKQAEKSGGKVHFLLGNHEYMVMQNDLRYVNKKYLLTANLLNTTYNELFNNQTVLGRWLRSKPTIIKINDNLFVHGGISQEFIENGFDLENTNQNIRQSLFKDERVTKLDSVYGKYYDSNGPIWYRGYFSDDFKKSDINKLLRRLDVKHIVVGHTSQPEILTLFKSKILAVDSSIKNGEYGEILFIENNSYSRGTMYGNKIRLD